jgi:protein-S-isoprenylcysteine O-methyltransferase Ste14
MASETSSKAQAPEGDIIARGNYKTSYIGNSFFIAWRLAEPLVLYKLLKPGGPGESLVSYLGLSVVSDGPAFTTGLGLLDQLGLPLPRLLLFLVPIAGVAKHIFWILFLNAEQVTPPNGFLIGFSQMVMNTSSTLLYLPAVTSIWPSSQPRLSIPGTDSSLPLATAVGAALYLLGLGLEWAAECQRRIFKNKSENKGKLCTTGLWSWVRHPNFGGCIVERGSLALMSSGVVAALTFGGFMFNVLGGPRGADKNLDVYCGQKYGEQWAKYKKDVRYKFWPGIF